MMRWFPFIALIAAYGASALPAQEAMTFEWNGIEHRESRQVEGDIITLRDEEDGFAVILDYERDIMMIKNVTSKTCFFTSLRNIPVAKDKKVPFMVATVTNETTTMVSVNVSSRFNYLLHRVRFTTQTSKGTCDKRNPSIIGIEERSADPILFSVVGEIPANYIKLTNDESVVVECLSGTSVAIEEKPTTKRAIITGSAVVGLFSLIVALIDLASPNYHYHYHTQDDNVDVRYRH